MLILLLSLVSSVLYKFGGCGREEIKFANSQFRDIGCPIVIFVVLMLNGITWYLALASSLIVLGFIRTYWDFVYKNTDNMYLHGVGIGLGMIPLYWSGLLWFPIVLYTATISLTMGALNTICTRFKVPASVWVEELFRGFIIVYAMKLLFIW